jgi:hypothetical protein
LLGAALFPSSGFLSPESCITQFSALAKSSVTQLSVLAEFYVTWISVLGEFSVTRLSVLAEFSLTRLSVLATLLQPHVFCCVTNLANSICSLIRDVVLANLANPANPTRVVLLRLANLVNPAVVTPIFSLVHDLYSSTYHN